VANFCGEYILAKLDSVVGGATEDPRMDLFSRFVLIKLLLLCFGRGLNPFSPPDIISIKNTFFDFSSVYYLYFNGLV